MKKLFYHIHIFFLFAVLIFFTLPLVAKLTLFQQMV